MALPPKAATVEHVFPRPGMRTVQVSVKSGTRSLGPVSQTINVHPNWVQSSIAVPDLDPTQQADIMGRNLALFSASDLAGCAAVFGFYKNADALLKILPAASAKMKEMSDADLPYLKTAGLYVANNDLLHAAAATQFFQAMLDHCTTENPSPQMNTFAGEARLALAQLTLKTTDHIDEVKTLVNAIDPKVLNSDERHEFDLLQADLAMATGDVAGATKQYQKMAGSSAGATTASDARSSIRFTGLIGQARAYIAGKDFESAEKSLADVAKQAPVEKMSSDWALTRLRLYVAEGLPDVAYLWGTRLLPVITDDHRSELLYRLADLAFSQGNHPDVGQESSRGTFTELSLQR